MNVHDLIFLILPAVLPVILAYFNNPAWPPVAKAIVPFVVCMVLATVEVLVSTPAATAQGWLTVIAQAYAICMASYAGFWKNPIIGKILGLSESNLSDQVESHSGTGS